MSDSIVIIPTYNEKENIENIIRAVFGLEKVFHILVIDDGSPDGTAAIVKGLQKEFGGDYDVIVANIVADVIIALAPQVGRLLKEGGIFLCSGIIDDRADEVREKLIEAGWTIEETRSSEGWFSYLCR